MKGLNLCHNITETVNFKKKFTITPAFASVGRYLPHTGCVYGQGGWGESELAAAVARAGVCSPFIKARMFSSEAAARFLPLS